MNDDTTSEQTSSVLNDRIFKYVFSNTVVLEDLLKSIFGYLETNEAIKVKELIPQKLIQSNRIDKKDFYGDLVVKLENGNLINLEVYTNFDEYDFNKSFCYLCRLYSNQMEYGEEDYQKCKKVYSINIVDSLKNCEIDESYNVKHFKKLRIIECGNINMIIIALDEFKNDKGYDKRMIKWLRWLMTKDEKEQDEISKGDEPMEIASNALREFMKTQPQTLEEYYERRFKQQTYKNIYRAEKELRKNTAIAMLQKDLPIDTISDVTNLSKDKIKKIAAENGFTIQDNKTDSEK